MEGDENRNADKVDIQLKDTRRESTMLVVVGNSESHYSGASVFKQLSS